MIQITGINLDIWKTHHSNLPVAGTERGSA